MKVDRQCADDAQKVFERLIPDASARLQIAQVLATDVLVVAAHDAGNWNLNLDLNGAFVRLNFGQEYAVEVDQHGCLLAGMKSGIPAQVDSVKFLGHQGRKSVTAARAEGVPDLLIKVPGSVGCLINLDGAASSLEQLLPSHQAFCLRAIRQTRIKPRMCRAHSTGAIAYLTELLGLAIPDPSYISAPFEGQGDSRESAALPDAISSSDVQAGHPARVSMLTTRYLRDPAVVRAARERANGVCEHCGMPAPFVSRETGQPFLEVHHLTPLAEKGEDVLDNVKALCPNCHRKLHYG